MSHSLFTIHLPLRRQLVPAIALLALARTAHAQIEQLTLEVDSAVASEVQAAADIERERLDGLRTAFFGSTSAKVSGNRVTITFRGWGPAPELAKAVALSERHFRVCVDPSRFDVLLTEEDIADARAIIGEGPEVLLRLNESGVGKLKARSSSLIGQFLTTYWDRRVVSHARVSGELGRNVVLTMSSEETTQLMSAVLRAGPLPYKVRVIGSN